MPKNYKTALWLLLPLSIITIYARANNIDTTKTTERTIFATLQAEQVSEVVIRTTLDSLILNKRTLKQFPATFVFNKKDGTTVEKLVQLAPRGKSRRKYCHFPPLKVSFSKEALKASGLRTQHKALKLVTHCLETPTTDANILKEFLAYQIYNELTAYGLTAQLLKIRYEDTDNDQVLEHFAILLEDIDEMAERLHGAETQQYSLEQKDFPDEVVNTFTLFQYLLGN
ncbi:MAG: hypothetical protein AAGJ18_08640 [Bacteroidota bacterium]